MKYTFDEVMSHTFTVLMIDDDYMNAEKYMDSLNLSKLFTASLVDNVSNFLTRVNSKEYDIYVLDMQINDNSVKNRERAGLDLLRILQETHPDAKTVALTGSTYNIEWFNNEDDDTVDYFYKYDCPPDRFPNMLYASALKLYFPDEYDDFMEMNHWKTSPREILNHAYVLLKQGHIENAIGDGRIALEDALKYLCQRNNIPTQKEETNKEMYIDLQELNKRLFDSHVYTKDTKDQIFRWKEYSNPYHHSNRGKKPEKPPTKEEALIMLDGVSSFIKGFADNL